MGTLLDTPTVTIFDEPKIDCHNHLLDPSSFRVRAHRLVPPGRKRAGHGTPTHRPVRRLRLTACAAGRPNSGYDTDNRCLLDFLQRGNGAVKGLAVVDNDTSRSELEQLRDRGVVGTTMQAALLGVE